MQTNEISASDMHQIETKITEGVSDIIEKSKRKVAVYLNGEIAMTYWRIGKYVAEELATLGNERYGAKIVATVSQQLTQRYGKGYTKDAIFRMVKVAKAFPDVKKVGTLSRQLTWSHLIELTEVLEPTKRLFYQQMTIFNHWSVRFCRTAQWMRDAGDGAFLNAARLTASAAPFRCDASLSRRLAGTWNVVDELN